MADGLVPNQSHTLAIAAIDDATDLDAGASHPRLGAISDITVDLTWRTETYDIPRSDGDWAGGGLSGQASPITRAGDVDNSGQDDVVVTYWTFQGGFQTAAHLILGNNDTANAVSAPLVFPAELSFVVASAGGQDVNGDGISDIVLGGFNAGFTSGTVAIYLGCDLATDCDLATLTTSDAVFTLPGRLLNGVNVIGNFHQRSGDSTAFADILVGGSSLPGGTETTAWVIAGRSVWANVEIQTASGVASDNANNTNGVTTLQTTTAVPGQSASAIGDLNNDGFVEIAMSGGTSPGFVHVVEGGADIGGRLVVDAATLVGIPSCMREVNTNESVGFGQDIEGGIDLDGTAGGDFAVSNLEGVVAVMSQDLAEVDCFTYGGPFRFGTDTSLAGDLDGDGHQDLIVSHGVNHGSSVSTDTNAYVFLNDGNGQFGIPYNTGVQRRAHMRLDAVTVTSGAPNYESGVSGVSGIGDFNGDSTADIGAVIKQTGSGSLQLVVYY